MPPKKLAQFESEQTAFRSRAAVNSPFHQFSFLPSPQMSSNNNDPTCAPFGSPEYHQKKQVDAIKFMDWGTAKAESANRCAHAMEKNTKGAKGWTDSIKGAYNDYKHSVDPEFGLSKSTSMVSSTTLGSGWGMTQST